MTHLNTYKPPPPPAIPKLAHLDTKPEEYDFNFCFDVKELSTDRVQLRPLVPSLHARLLYDEIKKCDPIILRWLNDFNTFDDFLRWMEGTIRSQPSALGYAIFSAPAGKDEPTDPKDFHIAGSCALINTDVGMMVSELGWIIILEKFQRTHVLTHTAGLLAHRILDMPSEGGLGLRRCQWFATSLNEKSRAASLRLGFKEDGILRNHRVLNKGKEGANRGRKGDYREDCDSRDSWLACITWQDWENGGAREHIDKLMARRK
ncbi:hypothetical protein IAU59_004304 [Kwoniella sp. CBS 9459]